MFSTRASSLRTQSIIQENASRRCNDYNASRKQAKRWNALQCIKSSYRGSMPLYDGSSVKPGVVRCTREIESNYCPDPTSIVVPSIVNLEAPSGRTISGTHCRRGRRLMFDRKMAIRIAEKNIVESPCARCRGIIETSRARESRLRVQGSNHDGQKYLVIISVRFSLLLG